jgi:tRNA (cmo5U34)-methyltransferase
MAKSTVDEIRRRFDDDVERFSNLQTGQSATIDAPLAMDLVTEAAARATPHARHVVDVGCGAGNYTLKLMERLPNLDVTLIDLSRPMLDRAVERVRGATAGAIEPIQGDIREIDLGREQCDIILAAAVLHHLRNHDEWDAVFRKFHAALRPGGSLWIFDMVASGIPAVQDMLWERYGAYLAALKDETYRDHVFAYIEQEDTPQSLVYQLDLLRRAGFASCDVLHKHGPFAAFGAVKSLSGEQSSRRSPPGQL